MSSFNGGAGALVNIAGTAQALADTTGLTTQITGDTERVQFIQESLGVVLQCDATIAEAHQMDASPTLFPLEDGSAITDHVILAPVQVNVTGIVSDTPLSNPQRRIVQTLGAAAATRLPALGVAVAATGYALYNGLNNDPTPAKTAYAALVRLRQGDPNTPPQPFTLMTKLARYESMIMTSLSFPVDASTDGALVFSAVCTKILVVQPQSVNISLLNNKALAAAKAKLGDKDAQQRSGFTDGANAGDAATSPYTRPTASTLRAMKTPG